MAFTFRNSQKHDTLYFDKDYKLAKTFSPLLHKPLIKKQQLDQIVPDLTYRKLHIWAEADIISYSRETGSEDWRRFSIVDVVFLQIVSALRTLGLSVETIKTLKDSILHSSFEQNVHGKVETVPFLEFEFNLFKAMSEAKILLIVNPSTKDPVRFGPEKSIIVQFLTDWDGETPYITLPFYYYVMSLLKAFKHPVSIKSDSTIASILIQLRYKPSAREQKMLEIIRGRKYEEISIRKSDDKSYIIKAKSRASGNFTDADIISVIASKDYQSVTVVTNKGDRVALIQEENIKV